MATKKTAIPIIDVDPVVVVSPKVYEVTITGLDGLLPDRCPLMDKPKSEAKSAVKEDPTLREWRIWREKLYVFPNGMTYIPGENIHECLKEGSKYWGATIPGEGKKKYTDVVASACIVEPMPLGLHQDDERIIPFGVMCSANPTIGKGGGKVFKVRPLIRPWGGTFTIHVFDARLTPMVLKTIITFAGSFKGLCNWRPKFGRFKLVNITEKVLANAE